MSYFLILALVLGMAVAQERVMLFHDGTGEYIQAMNLSEFRNSPLYIAYNW